MLFNQILSDYCLYLLGYPFRTMFTKENKILFLGFPIYISICLGNIVDTTIWWIYPKKWNKPQLPQTFFGGFNPKAFEVAPMPFPHNPFFLLGHLVMYTSGLPAGLHPRGGNRLFSKGSLFLRGLPCPREKQHLFFKEFLLFSKTLLQTFFSKGCHSFGAGHIHKPFFQRLQLFGFAFLSFFAKDVVFFACMVPFFQGLQLLACSSQVYQICHSCHKIRVHMDPLFFCPWVPLPVGGNWDHI